jgi:hypothetical protein
VEIPSSEHWLLTWPMTLWCKGLVWHMDGFRMTSRCVAGVCGVRPGKRLFLSLGVHATVFQAEILACTKECIGRAYTDEHIYIHAPIAKQLCGPLRNQG